MTTSKTCAKCREVKPLADYGKNKSKTDGLQAYCFICHRKANNLSAKKQWSEDKVKKRAYQERRRLENRYRFFEWLAVHPCIDCGEADILVLELDHIVPKEKRHHALSQLAASNSSWKRIQEEIDKCVVRCANCHRRKTFIERGNHKVKWIQDNLQSTTLSE